MRKIQIKTVFLPTIFVVGAILAGLSGCAKQPDMAGHEHAHEMNSPARATTNGTGKSRPQAAAVVTVKDGAFDPAHLMVKAGSTVTWVNKDAGAHEIHADDDSFQSPKLPPGKSFSQKFDGPGDYSYHCHLHESEKGMIMVE